MFAFVNLVAATIVSLAGPSIPVDRTFLPLKIFPAFTLGADIESLDLVKDPSNKGIPKILIDVQVKAKIPFADSTVPRKISSYVYSTSINCDGDAVTFLVSRSFDEANVMMSSNQKAFVVSNQHDDQAISVLMDAVCGPFGGTHLPDSNEKWDRLVPKVSPMRDIRTHL